jgi:hypothetical protein
MERRTRVTERVAGIQWGFRPVYRCLRTAPTASSSAEEAWTRRRKARVPSSERSRSSRRRRGLRDGFTFDLEVASGVISSRWGTLDAAEDCGRADGCGAEDCVVEDCGTEGVFGGAGDMVWKYVGVVEDDIRKKRKTSLNRGRRHGGNYRRLMMLNVIDKPQRQEMWGFSFDKRFGWADRPSGVFRKCCRLQRFI